MDQTFWEIGSNLSQESNRSMLLDGQQTDEFGRPLIDETKFPDMKAMTTLGHSLNLTVGWCESERAMLAAAPLPDPTPLAAAVQITTTVGATTTAPPHSALQPTSTPPSPSASTPSSSTAAARRRTWRCGRPCST